MVATLNFNLRDAPADVFDGIRWTLLTFFILHGNERNRSWPSMRSLAERLGKSLPYVTEAKQWLLDHGAVRLVPYKERVGDDEKKVSKRQHMYELTGKIKIAETVVHYLYFAPTSGDCEKDMDQPPLTSTPLNINAIDDQRGSPLNVSSKKIDSFTNVQESIAPGIKPSKPKAKAKPKQKATKAETSQIWYSVAGDNVHCHLMKDKKALCGHTPFSHPDKWTGKVNAGLSECPDCLKELSAPTVKDRWPQYGDLMVLVHKHAFNGALDNASRGRAGDATKALLRAYPLTSIEEFQRFANGWGASNFPRGEKTLTSAFGAWKAAHISPASTITEPAKTPEEVEQDEAEYLEWLNAQAAPKSVRNTAWDGAMDQLQLQVNKSTFDTWFRRIRLIQVNWGEPQVFIVEVLNEMHKQYIERHLMHSLLRTLKDRARCEVRVEIRIAEHGA